ncbi:MAG: undecaprenyl-diphosphate phosphatase [Armatimonadetes bacterium]|nr:undecaprenyl-diphosphate phosphatase [Armatimonadota bacterium]
MFPLIILGVVQGLTEFLPVSSSAHLVFAQALLGMPRQGVALEVLLHVGTLAAVLWAFREDVAVLVAGCLHTLAAGPRGGVAGNPDPRARLTWLIVIGTIPTGIIGVLFGPLFERLFDSVTATAALLIVTGVILMTMLRVSTRKSVDRMTVGDALVVGVAQGCAIAPGISRSGTTIAAGRWLGLDQEAAARFSFLLSIPAIAGAAALKLPDLRGTVGLGYSPAALGAGFAASLVSGYAAIVLLLRVARRGRLHLFAYYCWAAGAIMLVWSLRR